MPQTFARNKERKGEDAARLGQQQRSPLSQSTPHTFICEKRKENSVGPGIAIYSLNMDHSVTSCINTIISTARNRPQSQHSTTFS
jgi:hypothetical protein